jgi:threonine dehydrogenase-like Zn-dependent dehydrogenase
MRAVAFFPKAREIRVIERPHPPAVTGTQVLLRILEVGICGTDREIVGLVHGAPPEGSDHLILGHEALGEVVETGPAVSLVAKGDLVVPTVRRPCSHATCRPCRADRADFCVTGDFVERGIKGAHGFLQEWVVEDEANLIVAPRKLADVAILTEPLTVAAKARAQAAAIQSRLPWSRARVRALALGAGPVGLLAALTAAVDQYVTFVYSLEPKTDMRADITRSFGATYISGKDVPLDQLGAYLGGVDLVFEAAGSSAVAFAVLKALGPNGVFVLTGVPGKGEPKSTDTDTIMRNIVLKNQVVFGTVNADRSNYVEALHILEQGMFLFPEALRRIISEKRPIEDAPRIVAERGGIKQVVQVGKRGAA